ncbi:NAD(P)-binding protein [Aaosphaeria arxii CBS 175.79]|uniref:NAD(P)-binding protein n=1 Tax=Aaosphaeria arxii CBS 175.79 TaxID=1450172 RepID=A0A6A5Y5Y0_9PLEO|nr:NAD(P)-binding protein [Aaosphaeria arxii CBS 175.79]KAF2020965.1 NAD(P)-binding protein [Aaosphaeria arxii CBS 175.79]
MSSSQRILLVGAGELGQAFLPHLSTLPNTTITIAVRTASKYNHLIDDNINIISLDLSGPSSDVAKCLANYDIVVSCSGFGQPAGTVTKLAEDVLEAGKQRKEAGKSPVWFFPWQWGVDYDITGDGGGLMPLFGEQREVRNLLRQEASQSHVKWTIVSTGIFMSFLFEQFWGIVVRQENQITVRALRSWNHKITVTDVKDIGKVLARIVAGDVEGKDRIVYAAGDTVSYAKLADTIEQITKGRVDREEWTVAHLKEELEKDPDDLIKKYRLVFAGDGVWWNKDLTVNYKLNMPVMTVEDYARELLS